MIRLNLPPDVPDLDGEEPQQRRPGLSWRDWCEVLLIVALASGASAGLTLGIDRAWHGGPVICLGSTLPG